MPGDFSTFLSAERCGSTRLHTVGRMSPFTSPRDTEHPPWSAEQMLSDHNPVHTAWRERSQSLASRHAPGPLERRPQLRARALMSRAIAVPLLAGGALFALAVVAAIVVATLHMQPSVAASEQLTSAGSPTQGKSADSNTAAAGSNLADDEQPADAASSEAHEAKAQLIFVHVIGAVKRPGVVQVPSGSRVSAVIEAAGGADETAVLSGVNLAREALDGEQLLVPTAEQVEAGAMESDVLGKNGSGAGNGAQGSGSSSLIDLNRADVAAFETLPRVGPALAARIVDWRETHGRFTSIDQLLEVSGIGEKTLDGFRTLVTVS